MTGSSGAFAIACLCLFAFHAGAQEAAADPDAAVREILELSGQRKMLEQLVAQSQEQISQARKELKPEEYQRFQAAMKTAFQLEPLYQTVFEHHRGAYDAKRATALLEWLRGPLGRKIIEQELKALTSRDAKARQKYLEQLQAKPLPATREALIERVQEASRAMELTRRTVTVMVRSTVTSANASMPVDKRQSASKLDEAIFRTLASIDPPLRQAVRGSMLYTYRDMPDDELRAYIKFLDSELGRWYVQTGMDASMKAIELAGTKVGAELGKIVEEKKEEKKPPKKAPKKKKRRK
jgi:hypothetical protein